MTTFSININVIERKKLAENLGLTDIEEVTNLVIKDFILNKSHENQKARYERLRNEKLVQDIELKKLQIKYYNTFENLPSSQAETAMKKNIENITIPYNKGNRCIQCTKCGILFSGNLIVQKEGYVDHMYHKHGSSISEFEMKFLSTVK